MDFRFVVCFCGRMRTSKIDSFFKKVDTRKPSNSALGENLSDEPATVQEVEQQSKANSKRKGEVQFEQIEPSKVPRVEHSNANKETPVILERDPALRKQIFEYSTEKERDIIRREYLRLKAFQPILDTYPYSGSAKHRRSFQSVWFKQFPWLEYSPSKDAAFCFPCFLFAKQPNGKFIQDGFQNWRKVNNGKQCAFVVHMGKNPNSLHNINQMSCEYLLNYNQHIAPAVMRISSEVLKKNTMRLRASVDAARWLAFQGLPFRGHNEKKDSLNRGNFIELIKHKASDNEALQKVVLENAPGNAIYTSSMIQKEILQVFANMVQEEIKKEIRDQKFCVLLDESQDKAKREQMAIVLRFVDRMGILKERFFDLVHVEDTSSLTLQQELYRTLSYHNLSLKNIRGQGYDGASNMRGEFNGLKALVLKDAPYAYYVHCFAHRLQLVLVAAAKEVIPIQQYFTRLAVLVNLVSASSKRSDQLQHAQEQEMNDKIISGDVTQTGRGLNQKRSLQRAVDTRWSSHLNSVESLIEIFAPTGTVLKNIIRDGNSEQRAQADAAYDRLISFDFIFITHLMKDLLGKTNNLCQALQRRNQDIVTAMELVSTTKISIQAYRDSGWDCFSAKVKSFCEKHEVEIPDMSTRFRGGAGQSRKHHVTVEHYYHKEVFFQATDSLLLELNHRFDDRVIDLLALSGALNPRRSFKSFEVSKICDLVNKFYPEDFSNQEKHRLECELEHFHMTVSKNASFQKLSSLSELCQKLAETEYSVIYPLVDRLIGLVLILPVSTATCERAFSAMNIVKTKLRSKMEDDYLRDTLLIYIEKEISMKFSIESIMDAFMKMKDRKIEIVRGSSEVAATEGTGVGSTEQYHASDTSEDNEE